MLGVSYVRAGNELANDVPHAVRRHLRTSKGHTVRCWAVAQSGGSYSTLRCLVNADKVGITALSSKQLCTTQEMHMF